ncbi:DEAD/DEAH box helicase family protein [Rickettsiaceae bacterium]|nr:DEAD/DEAH box helicase family protein [Rickettsiaceae bacterium]
MQLKNYQKQCLEALSEFLELSRLHDVQSAYNEIQRKRYNGNNYKPYQPLDQLDNVPYICLRIPTGGGKTLLSAHTISIARQSFLERQNPVTLWLVPTNTIKLQTLETLQNPKHPNYHVLEEAFDGRFKVFDIANFRQIRPQDISDSACVIISTFASLRVDKTDGRKAYDHDENLEPHFSVIPAYANGMEKHDNGAIKFSFANLLNWQKPLVIVDEAHNAKTPLSNEVLKRVNASCVIEYTATPAKNSNVIISVSASELKAEEMIKLPIILSDPSSWEQAIVNSIQTRQKLEDIAKKDKNYIRPIVLFQAQNKDQEITEKVLKDYLIENEGIPVEQIAIATGGKKELDNIDLLDPNCPIRYVITVQALKEGWDCPFAYVLCSVANTKSEGSVEQLLGRVLRMPYAEKRTENDLNKAYAYVSSNSWTHAVSKMHDKLVNMGFEEQEVEDFIYTQPSFPVSSGIKEPFTVSIKNKPDLSTLEPLMLSCLSITEHSENNYEIRAKNGIDSNFAKTFISSIKDKKDKAEVELKAKLYLKSYLPNSSPSEKGDAFIIPQLCLNIDGIIELAEPDLYLDKNGWNLLDYSAVLTQDEFTINEQAKQYALDIAGKKLVVKFLDHPEQLSFEGITTEWTDIDLCRWLDRKLKAYDIKQEVLLEFLRLSIQNLLRRDNLDLAQLLRGKYVLEKVLREKIKHYRQEASNKGYQSCMFSHESIATIDSKNFSFSFDPSNYPANSLYQGKLSFGKHYYSRIASMNNEEANCAFLLDQNPHIKYWVRNLERDPRHAFWLPTATDKFYPDFVAQLNSGKILVIEYKGQHLDGSDAKEKEMIGKVWEEKSGNIFLMAWAKDQMGNNLERQINNCLGTNK